MKTKIIGLAGKAGSGKDTAAEVLTVRCGSYRMSFADRLKNIVAGLGLFPRDVLYGPSHLRNTEHPTLKRPDGSPLTARFALQTLGTEWGRNCSPDIWASVGIRDALDWLESESPNYFIVFADCRFVNEARAIREVGGEVWQIIRPGAGLTGEAANHPSETEQDTEEFQALVNVWISNNGTKEEFEDRVRNAANQAGLKL